MNQIYIHYGTRHIQMAAELMARWHRDAGHIRPEMAVAVKPNLVVSRPAEEGATTHPEVVEGIVLFLQELGVKNIRIIESAWVGDSTRKAFQVCGYEELARRYGVKLVDLKQDQVERVQAAGMELGVCREALACDFLINVPVLKAHCQTLMTCCLKNMKGCIPDAEKRRYHTMGLDRPIAALGTVLRADLQLVDGICGDLTFEEGGNPVEENRLLLAEDPVLLDSYCAGLLGYSTEEIGYLPLAREWGAGRFADANTQVVELAENRPQVSARPAGIAARLSAHVEERSACSACYASLIRALHRAGGPREGGRVKIGQGFRGTACTGVGVGNCAAGCGDGYVPGCPPRSVDIVRALEEGFRRR